jgi:NAD(P)H-flavin reductase
VTAAVAGAGLGVVQDLVPVAARVRDARRESADVVTLRLQRDGGGAWPPFAPGQFNMLYAFGIGEAAISMSGDAGDAATAVHTVRALGPVTQAICALGAGATVGVRGPFGRPWPVDAAEGGDLLIIAGGLGLAPLRPAIYHAARHRDRYGRVVVLAGARTPADLLFADELPAWRAAGVDARLVVDRAAPGWTGRVGVVPDLIADTGVDAARAFVLACGPEVMMRYALPPLARLGVPDQRIFLSLERSMKCAVAFCGHCQLGPAFVCKDGPVFSFAELRRWFFIREL